LSLSTAAQQQIFDSADLHEGVAAFLAKREPGIPRTIGMEKISARRSGRARAGRRCDPDQRLGRRALGAGGAARRGRAPLPGRRQAAGITSVSVVGVGDRISLGADHIGHEGLLRRAITSALVDSPRLVALAAADKIEAYTLPQGVLSQLMRDMAAGRPGS
jgi:hypothetical protein